MNERERAEALARAIDELIRGAQSPEPHFDDEELRSLLRVAGARLQQSSEAVLKAADHETEIWRRLVSRIENGEQSAGADSEELTSEDDVRDVIAARRRASEDVHALAEKHREDVWRRVQERINKVRPKRKGIFSFFQSRTDGDLPDGPPASRTRLIPTGDSDLDSLLRVALGHTSLRQAGERESSGTQYQLLQRMRTDPANQRSRAFVTPQHTPLFGLRAGVFAAVFAVAIAILGPVPFTGLAHTPAAEAARFVGQHVGVMETDQSPPAPGPATTVQGEDMSATEASARLGLPLTAPTDLLGLPLSSQRFYTEGLTSSGSGAFLATYKSADGSAALAVYEEAAGGNDFAVPPGSAVDVSMDGSPATYFEGGWSSENGALTWQALGTQTLIFQRDGVRFVLQYTGTHVDPAAFAAAAVALG